MKALILSCFSRPRRLAALAALGLFAITAQAQVVTWTSSHPDIVSVDENTGTIEMISEPAATTDVTITATMQQNGKTLTSIKTVQVDSCTACFNYQASGDSQAREYCGVKLSNGQCWMDRNLGASRVATDVRDTEAHGVKYSSFPSNVCPTGWSIPTSQQWLSALSEITGRTITATTDYKQISNTEMFNSELKLVSMHRDDTYLCEGWYYYGTGGAATGTVQWIGGCCSNCSRNVVVPNMIDKTSHTRCIKI